MSAISRFENDFFTRDDPSINLTAAESELIVATLGRESQRWLGFPDPQKMAACLTKNPNVLERIGSRLLNTIIGIKGCGPAVRFLLDHNTPFNMVQDAYNQMHEGTWANAVDTLEALFESGVVDATCVSVKKPHVGWPDNISLMYWPANQGRLEMAKLLIKYGVGVHHELKIKGNGERGTTSLQEAVSPAQQGTIAEHHEVAHLLIEDGAYYDLGSACALNDVNRIKQLLADNPNLADSPLDYDMTPLHWSARAGSVEATEFLLKLDVAVNPLNKANRAPIHMAAELGHEHIVSLLNQYKVDLNIQDKKGRTPLHRATYEGRLETAETLLSLGADPTIVNKQGKNALQIARKEAKILKELA